MRHEDFIQRLTLEYPHTAKNNDVERFIVPTLIAPRVIDFPLAWLKSAEKVAALFHNEIRESRFSETQIASLAPPVAKPKTSSVLMSYDYHVDFSKVPSGELRLIEINTNASMSLLLDVLNCQLGVDRCLKDDFMDDFEAALGEPLQGKRAVIIDEKPESQKLFVEFLMYKELFESRGASCRIVDRTNLVFENGELRLKQDPAFGAIDLVYNRLTDFYFEQPESSALRQATEYGKVAITPHPYDYRTLADKSRMVEWSRPNGFERYGLSAENADILRACLIRTREVSEWDPDELWKERKHLIFKPKTSHAGKGVYRGSSISRGAFQGVIESGGLAQDFVPAPTIKLGEAEFKYDLRFFAFKDRIHVACARLYQGQMTNATTPGGGVAAIRWR